jgi:hypothetical protein
MDEPAGVRNKAREQLKRARAAKEAYAGPMLSCQPIETHVTHVVLGSDRVPPRLRCPLEPP